jgi:hypothetical protein
MAGVSILRGDVFPAIDDAAWGEEHEMDKITDVGEPASELERLIADLAGSGLLAFVFGVGWWAAHLRGVTTPLFRGPADRRWWHVKLGDDAANWTMDVRVDEITRRPFRARALPVPLVPRAGSLGRGIPRARRGERARLLRARPV